MIITILAIDFGKFSTVLCWYEWASRVASFRTVRTTPEELRRELLRQSLTLSETNVAPGFVCDPCGRGLRQKILVTANSRVNPDSSQDLETAKTEDPRKARTNALIHPRHHSRMVRRAFTR